jgi:hypothetical protein
MRQRFIIGNVLVVLMTILSTDLSEANCQPIVPVSSILELDFMWQMFELPAHTMQCLYYLHKLGGDEPLERYVQMDENGTFLADSSTHRSHGTVYDLAF